MWISFETMDMLDVPEEVLGRLPEKGKVKSRYADGAILFPKGGDRGAR
jgi:hypothetical protein